MRLLGSPRALAIHLKLFSCDAGGGWQKAGAHVAPSLRLVLEEPPAAAYDLAAIVVHHGGPSPGAGHYTACVRRGAQWYGVDGEMVRPMATAELLAQTPYLSFYDRAGGESASAPPQAAVPVAANAAPLLPTLALQPGKRKMEGDGPPTQEADVRRRPVAAAAAAAEVTAPPSSGPAPRPAAGALSVTWVFHQPDGHVHWPKPMETWPGKAVYAPGTTSSVHHQPIMRLRSLNLLLYEAAMACGVEARKAWWQLCIQVAQLELNLHRMQEQRRPFGGRAPAPPPSRTHGRGVAAGEERSAVARKPAEIERQRLMTLLRIARSLAVRVRPRGQPLHGWTGEL